MIDRIQDLWSWALTLATVGLGWFLRTLWDNQKETTKALNELEIRLARDYVTNVRAEQIAEHIDTRFDKFEKKLDGLFIPKDRRSSND